MDRTELADAFAGLGATFPEHWAGLEIDEDTPHLARYVFLKGAWEVVVDAEDSSWIDRVIGNTPVDSSEPFAGTAHALRRLLDAGADAGDINKVVRGMQADVVFGLCYLLDDPSVVEGNDVVNWALFETDEEDRPRREFDELHDSVLATDPSRRRMRPQ